MIAPEGWTAGVVGDAVASIHAGFSATGGAPRASDSQIAVLKTGSVSTGQFNHTANKAVIPRDLGRVQVEVRAGTIIFGRKNSEESVGASAYIEASHPLLYLSDLLWEIQANSMTDPRWLSYALQSDTMRQRIRISATGTQSTMKNISRDRLTNLCLSIPPLEEQRKIAAILQTWDVAINGVTGILRAKSVQLGELRQSVFDQRSGLAAGWKHQPLRSIAERVTSKSDGNLHPVMAISAKSGFELQSSKYSRDMAGASLANYTLLRQGEFAYNKGNSLTFPQGCVYQLDEDSALVPNVYFSFRLHEEHNGGFFAQYFAAGGLNRQLAQRISSGVRGNGLLNLNPTDFFGVQVPVPDLATQDRVADLLGATSREVALLARELTLVTDQKRGLMQKLLTGEVRVNVEMQPNS